MSQDLNLFSSLTTIMTSMLGSGINYMPAAFKNSGILFGIISLSFFGTLTGLSILMILITAKIRASEGIGYDITYAKLGLEINKYLQSAIDICIFLTQFFTGLGFQKYIAESLVVFIENFETGLPDFLIKIIVFTIITVPLTLLALKDNLSGLKICTYISVFSSISLACVIALLNIFGTDFIGNLNNDINFERDYVFSAGIFIFAMGCMANVVQVFKDMRIRKKINLIAISVLCPLFGIIVYSSIGTAGYHAIGNEILKNDIVKFFLKNSTSINKWLFKNKIWLFYILKIQGFLSLTALICSFPVQLSSATKFLKEFVENKSLNIKKPTTIIVLFMISIMTIVNMIPGIPLNFIFDIIGNTTCNYITFLFPSLLYMKTQNNIKKYKRIFCWCMIVGSICLSIYGTYNAIMQTFFVSHDSQSEFFNKASFNTTKEIHHLVISRN